MHGTTTVFYLKPNRYRQFLTGFVAPLVGIGLSVIIMIVAPQEPRKTTLGYLLASAMFISIVPGVRTAMVGFDRLAWDTVSERIEISRLFKRKRSVAATDIMGYSAFNVTRVGPGVVVYVADGSHIELTDATHPYLERFVQILRDRKVRYLGPEAGSIKRMFSYRYDQS